MNKRGRGDGSFVCLQLEMSEMDLSNLRNSIQWRNQDFATAGSVARARPDNALYSLCSKGAGKWDS